MRQTILFLTALILLFSLASCTDSWTVYSPNGSLAVTIRLINGQPKYEVFRDGQAVILPSALGFEIKDQPSLIGGFEVLNVEEGAFDETWSQPWGEVKNIRNHYHSLTVRLKERGSAGRQMNLVFRVFDDGVGFRYELPEQPGSKDWVVMNELTEFRMVGDFTAWWIPAQGDEMDYEYLYRSSKLSEIGQAVHTPLTMEAGDSLWVSIHEAALVDYAGMALLPEGQKLQSDLVPWSSGVKAEITLPFATPWRTIQLADTPGDLITSYLILNLNEPSRLADVSWIKPGKYTGIWWGMHVDTQTWGQGPKHGAATGNVKKLIDFTSENGFSGVLVEGWNEGWDNDWSGGLFHFTKPYPDFDMDMLSQYAREKKVSLIGHHETGGNIANYESQLTGAMAYYRSHGVNAVKTGYVNRRPAGGEFHQGQYMVRHYQRVVEEAARHQIMVDIHEPVKDTGLRRTWPNLMTREGVRGTEYEAWSKGNPPEHTVILPFTRGLAGPLDYTPGIFDILIKTRPENRVHTTLAKQLALYVLLYSPLQMVADLPENYEGQPAFQFIRDVPTDWEDTKVLNGQIGDFVTIVRKDSQSDNWYLGSATDEERRSLTVSLSFLLPGRKYKAEIYADAPDAHVDTNPTAVTLSDAVVQASDELVLELAPGGGQAIRFELLQ